MADARFLIVEGDLSDKALMFLRLAQALDPRGTKGWIVGEDGSFPVISWHSNPNHPSLLNIQVGAHTFRIPDWINENLFDGFFDGNQAFEALAREFIAFIDR